MPVLFGCGSGFFGSGSTMVRLKKGLERAGVAVSSGNTVVSSGILRDYLPHPSGILREIRRLLRELPKDSRSVPEAFPKDSRRSPEGSPKDVAGNPEEAPNKSRSVPEKTGSGRMRGIGSPQPDPGFALLFCSGIFYYLILPYPTA